MNKLIFWILCIFLVVSSVNATTYYADPVSGDDTNDGLTQGTAWKTIHNNLGSFNGLSNELILMDGIFDNESATALGGIYSTSGYNIKGMNVGKTEVVFNYSKIQYGFYINGASGMSLEGFNITSVPLDSINSAIRWRAPSSYLNITNMVFKDFYKIITIHNTNGELSNLTITNSSLLNIIDEIVPVYQTGKSFSNSYIINSTLDMGYNAKISDIMNSFCIGEDTLKFKDNTLQGRVNFDNQYVYEHFVNNNNIFNYDFLKLTDMAFEPAIVISDRFFDEGASVDGVNSIRIYEFDNVSNAIFRNITFCTENNWCEYDTSSTSYNFYLVGDNISLEDIEVYSNKTTPIALSGNNKITDLNIHTYGRVAAGVGGGIINITDSVFTTYSNVSYVLACGVETDATWARTCFIDNVDIYSYNSNDLNHGLFLGYTNNSIVKNVNLYGGGYGAVIKGNTNLYMENIYRDNNYQRNGIYIKAGNNLTFKNIEINTPFTVSTAIFTNWNSVDGMNVTNIVFENVSIYGTGGSLPQITVLYTENMVLKDVEGYDSLSVNSNSGIVDIMYSLDVLATDDTILNIEDNRSNTFGPYNTRYNDYLLSSQVSSSETIVFYPYTLTATYGDHVEVRTFDLIGPVSYIFIFNELIPHLQGVKIAVFAGFGLIAVALLASIAFLITKMFNNGADMASLTTISIMAIGLAIVLFVGYIIISAVAEGLI